MGSRTSLVGQWTLHNWKFPHLVVFSFTFSLCCVAVNYPLHTRISIHRSSGSLRPEKILQLVELDFGRGHSWEVRR